MDAAPDAEQRRAELERLAAEVVEPVRRFLARRTDPETAADVLGDVLLVLWRRLDAVPPEPLPWTYAVARHCLANAERSARRQRRVAARIARLDPPAVVAPGTDTHERVHAALAALRPDEAELLRLWAWEQLSPAEIAVVLDLSPNAVSIRLHRARGKLRDLLGKIDGRPGDKQPNEGSTP